MIACFIRYEIEPFGQEAFARYARVWNDAIPRCGAELTGYFAPHVGSATTAYGIFGVQDLAAYERYRTRLLADPAAVENFAFARRERFIRREDRWFLKRVDGLEGAA